MNRIKIAIHESRRIRDGTAMDAETSDMVVVIQNSAEDADMGDIESRTEDVEREAVGDGVKDILKGSMAGHLEGDREGNLDDNLEIALEDDPEGNPERFSWGILPVENIEAAGAGTASGTQILNCGNLVQKTQMAVGACLSARETNEEDIIQYLLSKLDGVRQSGGYMDGL